MRVCTVTPRLFVVVREDSALRGSENRADDSALAELVDAYESDPWRLEPDYVYLFDGYRSPRVRLSHHALRSLSKLAWLPPALAVPALKLGEAELLETLRGCDPDVVRAFGLPWERELLAMLSRRRPEWISGAEEAARFRARLRPGADPSGKVSIVLPTYNGVRYLRQAIESCLAQTHANLELIVVDDGSGPEVGEIVDSYRADDRVRYVRHDRNRGVAESLNTGFRLSTGPYLTWTSDDNYYETRALAEMLGFLARYPDVDFVYAECTEVDERGAVTRLMRPGPASALKINNFVGACFLYKRLVYERVGEYKPVPLVEDYDYWIRVARVCQMQRLFKPLYYYRAHPASLTGRHSPREVEERVTQIKRLNRFGSRRNW